MMRLQWATVAPLRQTARRLRRTPLFVAGVCAVLLVAVGGNTAMFAVVNAVVLRPLPVGDEQQLLAVHLSRPGAPRGPLSVPLFEDLQRAGSLSGAAAAFQWSANLADEAEAERLQGMRVSGNYFTLLGAGVALGRALQPDDARPESPAVVVISDGFWKRKFGASPSVIGQPMRLNGEVFTITGVLAPGFPFQILDTDVIAPWVREQDPRRASAAARFLRVVARLAPDASASQARAEIEAKLTEFRATYPQAVGADLSISLVGLRQDLLGDSTRMLVMLSIAMGAVMLIGLANLTNLFLVNGAGRSREFATRRALGASRAGIAGLLLTEALVLAVAGSLLGLLAATIALDVLIGVSGTAIPPSAEVSVDLAAAAFAFASGLAIALLAMLSPAVRLSKGAGHAPSERWATFDGRRARAFFVAAQVALSIVLLAGTGLLVRSFVAVQRVDPGFEPAGVLSIRLSLPRARYSDTSDLARFATDLAERVRSLPGVTSVAASNVVPMNGWMATSSVGVPGVESQPIDTWPEAHYRMITPDYFAVLGIPLTGRAFSEADVATTLPVAIVSRSFAAHHWGGQDPVGKQLKIRDSPASVRTVHIVGIAGDVRHLGLEADSPGEVYVPIPQVPDATSLWLANNMYWVARTTGNPLSYATAIRREVAAVDRDIAASFVRTMEQWLDRSVHARRFNLRVIAAFGLIALVLTSLGVYGVAAEAVALRTREIGVRAALGATTAELRRLIIKGGLAPVLGGAAFGLLGAAAAANLLATFLFGVEAHDAVTFAVTPALVIVVAAIAYSLPAWRVSKIDPVIALRGE